MKPRLKLSKEGPELRVDATDYRNIIGGLRYLTHTRPDITFAVGYLSRVMETPTTAHLAAVKHLLRYIAGTRRYGCKYTKGGDGGGLVGTATRTWPATLTIARAHPATSSSSEEHR